MNYTQMLELVKAESAKLVELFEKKNHSYGSDGSAFYNFTETARRTFGNGDLRHAFDILCILADKHWVALTNRGLDDPEAEERLRDIAVYAIIGIAMCQEWKGTDPVTKSFTVREEA